MHGAVGLSPCEAPLTGSGYADEAALPSFAEMAVAQGSLERTQHSGVCQAPIYRQTSKPPPDASSSLSIWLLLLHTT